MTESPRQRVAHDQEQHGWNGGEGEQGREHGAYDVEDPVTSLRGLRLSHRQDRS
jgi:hypothetical protein